MSRDIVADAFNKIKLYDRLGKRECIVNFSKLLVNILEVLKRYGYIEDYEEVEMEGKPYLKVMLKGEISQLGVIKPRYPVKYEEWVKVEQQYLPSYNLGIIIVTTPEGVLSNVEAKEKRIGGRLIGYVY